MYFLISGFMEPILIENNCAFLIKPIFKVTDYIPDLKRLVGDKGDFYVECVIRITGSVGNVILII